MRDKLLYYSTVISVLVNILFVILVGNSDIFQQQATKNEIRAMHIKIVRPPIKKKKAPPKKKLPPPIKKPPPVKQLPPPPTPVVQHTVVQRVIVPPKPQPIAVVSSSKGNETISAPTTPVAPPVQPAPTPPAPVVVATPPPPKPPPPPPPVEAPPAPKLVRLVVRAQAAPVGVFRDVTIPQDLDPSTLTATDVTVYFRVDESGNAHFERMSPPTTGSSELDDQIRKIIGEQKFQPATNPAGMPVSSEDKHEFSIQ